MTHALPECPHVVRCAGCTRLTQPYEAQLAARRERLAAALAAYPALRELSAPALVPAPSLSDCRPRAKLVAQSSPKGPVLGLYDRAGSHRVVDVPECRVLAPAVHTALAAVRDSWRSPERPAALTPAEAGGALLAVDAREVQAPGEPPKALLTLILEQRSAPSESELISLAKALLAAHPVLLSVSVSLHDGRSPQLLGGVPRVLAGEPTSRDSLDGALYVHAAPGSFVQAHRAGSRALYQHVAATLEARLGTLQDKRLVDAFAGSGALGFFLAARGARVELIESFLPAVEAALAAAHEQKLSVRARALDATVALRELAAKHTALDAVVLDPPRRGLSPSLRASIDALAPTAVVYVSCEPTTFARDLSHLATLGWRARSLRAFDLMPHTDEVESVALLELGPVPAAVPLAERASLVVVDKPPHLPLEPQSTSRHSQLARVWDLPGFERAEPVYPLDEGASGLCLFARTATSLTPLTAALFSEGSRRMYLALCKGIVRDKGILAHPMPGRVPARTRYRRLCVVGGHSLVALRADTNHPQQLQRHLAELGHPILGDPLHGDEGSNRHFAERHGLDRPFLHCALLELALPGVEPLRVTAPLAGDLASVLAQLGYTDDPLLRLAAR